jgi:HPt (histidine-containing phosphotransfer) domain-containing protein
MTIEKLPDSNSLLKVGQTTELADVPPNTLIDWNYLHELSDGNEAFELELLQTLIESLPSHLATLRQSIHTQDFRVIEHEAHYVKGSTTSIGAKTLQAIAEQLELQARQQHCENMEGLLNQLEYGFQQVEKMVLSKQHQYPPRTL